MYRSFFSSELKSLYSLYTDDFSIGFIIGLKQNSSPIINKYNCKKCINFTALKQFLRDESWVNLYNEENAQTSVETFIKTLKLYLEKVIVTRNIKGNSSARNECITPKIIKLVNRKNDLYRREMKNVQNTALREEYKHMKNNIIKISKICIR